MRLHILLALCLSFCQIHASPLFGWSFNPIATLQADLLKIINQAECLVATKVSIIPSILTFGNSNPVTSNKCSTTSGKTTSSAAIQTSLSSLQSVASSKWSSLQSLLSTTTSLPPILTTSFTATTAKPTTTSSVKSTSTTANTVSSTAKPSSITSTASSTASSTSKTSSSAVASGTPCAGNTAADRSKWCNYSTSTDYYNEVPDTGVTREVRTFSID